MAITWDIQISNVDVARRRGDVTATRTDSESSLPTEVYAFTAVPLETPQQRLALLNTIKARVVERAEHDASVEAIVTDLEDQGKTALEAWELTR
jgi:hypothetical protein